MINLLPWLLVMACAILALLNARAQPGAGVVSLFERVRSQRHLVPPVVGGACFAGCLAVAVALGVPVPLVHDEFSYLLLSNTLASGRLANPPPPLPEFFDTFHVLVSPMYVSKYWPGQGAFLAFGEWLVGQPVVGVWLSAALACAATAWMMTAWMGPVGALTGGVLFISQWGVYSYWSQSYWGGMVAAFGGALFFGAARRLWDKESPTLVTVLALGVVVLLCSRPVEGLIVCVPTGILLLRRWWPKSSLGSLNFVWLVSPALLVVAFAVCVGLYNNATTGSAFTPPYVIHERQYQETPQLTILSRRSPKTYSSPTVRELYTEFEGRLYEAQQGWPGRITSASPKLVEWWLFFGGVLMSAPLVAFALLSGGTTAQVQVVLLGGFWLVGARYGPPGPGLQLGVVVLACAEAWVFLSAYGSMWSRLAVATCLMLLVEVFFVKWFQPHYFAPAAPLIIFLQVEALRRLWHHSGPRCSWRATVMAVPVASTLLLGLNVTGRITGWWSETPRRGAATFLITKGGWSETRATLLQWLHDQGGRHLVFVRYSSEHNVHFEWVYNRARLLDEQVLWARDLGEEHNRRLLALLPDYTVWIVEADSEHPRLRPYAVSSKSEVRNLPARRDWLPW